MRPATAEENGAADLSVLRAYAEHGTRAPEPCRCVAPAACRAEGGRELCQCGRRIGGAS